MTTLSKDKLLFELSKAVWEKLPNDVKRTQHNREVVNKNIERLLDSLDFDS